MASTQHVRRHPSHRKRISALRLSSDTTATLPEYVAPPRRLLDEEYPDRPPDYPDSAEEADEDTDTDSNVVYLPPAATLPQRPHTASPRRPNKRFPPSHKKRPSFQHQPSLPPPPREDTSSSDPYLDSLLERSVHALEMSNTLLQSSISTQTSLSAILASDSHRDSTLEARAVNLSSRIKDTWDVGAAWADDLEEITRDVEGLFSDHLSEGSSHRPSSSRHSSQSHSRDFSASSRSSTLLMEGSSGISCSLPSTSPLQHGSRRRPSLDLRQASDTTSPRLNYSKQTRDNLVSPPPRALTQYVASSEDPENLILPSTIGLRALPTVHDTSEWKPLHEFASSSTTSLLSTTSLATICLPPKLTDKPIEPSTPAYHKLSSFVQRRPSSGSNTPSTSFTTSLLSNLRREPRNPSSGTERSGPSNRRHSSSPSSRSQHLDRRGSGSSSASAVSTGPSRTPRRGVSPIIALRPMTPPAEESSSSSSDGFIAKQTMKSLRKILDDQPAPPPPPPEPPGFKLKSPQFMPRSPAPVAEASTSTATASVSRLFTKGTHSSSTRAPSPPRHSAMKNSRNGSASNTAPPTPTRTSAPVGLGLGMVAASSSTSSTGDGTSTTTQSTSLTTSLARLSPSPTTLSIPDLVNKVLTVTRRPSPSSSGTSTPSKRISFAELPESYASTRPGGAGSGRFKDKGSKRKGKGRASSSSSSSKNTNGRPGSPGVENGGGGWWNGWLGNGGGGAVGGLGMHLARQEEKMEDRMTRSWGGRMGAGFGSGLDEWAI